MFKLTDKKIFAILRSKILLNWPYVIVLLVLLNTGLFRSLMEPIIFTCFLKLSKLTLCILMDFPMRIDCVFKFCGHSFNTLISVFYTGGLERWRGQD